MIFDWLYWKWVLKPQVFFFLSGFLLHHYSDFWYYDHYCIMEKLKKIGKKLEQIKNNKP